MNKCYVCGKGYPASREWCPHCEKRPGTPQEAKLSRYAAVSERVRVEQYEVARPVGSAIVSWWEPRWDVKVSFLTRDVAEAFAKALQESKAATETPNAPGKPTAANEPNEG